MLFLVGLAIVIGSVLGGYGVHGDLSVLVQPLELVIIGGSAVGAFVISNPKPVLAAAGKHLGRLMKGAPFSKANYLELLTLLYSVFKLAKIKGPLVLEAHIENPEESDLFAEFPGFLKNHHAVEFLCDYLRLITMGSDNPHELEALMDEDLGTHHDEAHAVANAFTAMGDGLPAFGIVAAVLGIIITMGSITEPPEILGELIGAALVGTFLGILLSYGVVGPIGKNLEAYANAEAKYYECMKQGLLAYLQGYAPQVCVEFARKTLFSHERPSFQELEEAVDAVPNPGAA